MIKNIIKLKLNIGIKIYYEKKYQKQKKNTDAAKNNTATDIQKSKPISCPAK